MPFLHSKASMAAVPDLSAKHLRALVSLARYGSFVAAAADLRLSQPGLSRIIAQAESRLGVRLFARGTRSVLPTEAGRTFIPAAERILGELTEQAEKARALDGEMRGQLVIACLMSISHRVLPDALVAFRKQHSKMQVQIREAIASGVIADVRSGLADFGIGPAIGSHGGIVADAVTTEACYVVLPRRHRLARLPTLRLKDLAGEPMVSMPTDSGLRRTVDGAAGAQGVLLTHGIITSQFSSLFGFVASELGVAIVPASALPGANEHGLVTRPLRPAITRRIGVLRLAERTPTAAATAFLDIFEPKLRAATSRRRHGSHP
jgi:LysR family carnitine catabolism transcriptional activator